MSMYRSAALRASIATCTSLTSIRGSHRRSAARTSAAMALAVSLSADANRESWMRQPNSGRIARSPGDVPRISRMASSISCSRDTRAMPPVASTRSGKAQPRPMNCSLTSSPARLVDLHGLALDGHRPGRLERHRPARLDLHVALRVDRDLPRGLDLQLLVLLVQDDVDVAVRREELDARVVLALEEADLVAGPGGEPEVGDGPVVEVLVVVERDDVLAVPQPAQHDRVVHVAVLERAQHLVVDRRQPGDARLLARPRSSDPTPERDGVVCEPRELDLHPSHLVGILVVAHDPDDDAVVPLLGREPLRHEPQDRAILPPRELEGRVVGAVHEL